MCPKSGVFFGRGGPISLWALDHSPSDLDLTPGSMRDVFAPKFLLRKVEKNRRRLVSSHWYWLERSSLEHE